MRKYKQLRSRLPRLQNRDFTKRGLYVRLDLFVRVLSAIALAALGAAGWWFQVTTQRQHDAIEERNREARKALPVVRSLSELEIVLDDVAHLLIEHGTDGAASKEDSIFFEELASHIDSAAVSTAIIADDPQAPLTLPSFYGPDLSPRRSRPLGVRSSAFMLAEVLRLLAIATKPGWCATGSEHRLATRSLGLHLEGDDAIVYIYCRNLDAAPTNDLQVSYFVPSRESARVWRSWLKDQREDRAHLDTVLSALPSAVLAVSRQVATASQQVMREYPELGDQFVAVRAEVMKTRRIEAPYLQLSRRQ